MNKKPKNGGSHALVIRGGEAGVQTDEETQEDEGGQARAKAKKQAGPIRFVVSARRRFFVLPPLPAA